MTRWFSMPIAAGWIVLTWAGVVCCDENRAMPRLAILVSDETDDPQTLQALLEAEAFHAWSGDLVERKQLDRVLREQQLGAALDPNDRLQLGRLLGADYLLIARRDAGQVHCLVNRFPDATVITEFRVPPASPDGLAKRLAVRAFRAINTDARGNDGDKLYVSLGSFLYDDPFERYTTFSDELHERLRQQIASHSRLMAAERFYPSHLLREFQLNRGGLTQTVAANLAAAPSDVLIVGQFEPSRVQPLDGKSVELSFVVRLLSPTALFPAKELRFTTSGPDVAKAAENIKPAIRQIVDSLGDKPLRRTGNHRSDEEFLTLKQQAFRLLPYPPKDDGNFHSQRSYRGSNQTGSKPYILRRALRAVENAMLFHGEDTQLLVCTGVLLQGLSNTVRWAEGRGNGSEQPGPQERALLAAGFDYLENALLLESNENTRGVCYEATTWRDRPLLPERVKAMAERMVREGTDAGWFPHQVKWAWIWLARLAPDMDTKIEHFRRAANQNVEPDTLFNLLVSVDTQVLKHPENTDIAEQAVQLADDLIQHDSVFHQAMGHYLRSRVDYCGDERDLRWLPHVRQAIDLIPAIHAEHGQAFIQCGLSYGIYNMLSVLLGVADHRELPGETLDLFEAYASRQTEIGNYSSANLTQCVLLLLPAMYKQERYDAALQLLSPLLERYTAGGAADFERMQLARWQDHLRQAISPKPRLRRDQVEQISLPTVDRNTRIKKLVYAGDRVWALRCDYWLQDRLGELFALPTGATEAAPVSDVEGVVTDIAASSDQLAVATIDRGLFLLDGTAGEKVDHLEPDNSPLPSERIRTVASDGSRFYIGLPGKGLYHVYELDPKTKTLRDMEAKLSYHAYYQTKYDRAEKRLIVQTWDERTFDDGGQTLRLQRKPRRDAIHVTAITDGTGRTLFEHEGLELNYIYDFIRWHDKLVFATGNGLYVVWPEDGQLRCVMNELELEFFSLCGVGKSLYVGTNQGLLRISHRILDDVAPGFPRSVQGDQ